VGLCVLNLYVRYRVGAREKKQGGLGDTGNQEHTRIYLFNYPRTGERARAPLQFVVCRAGGKKTSQRKIRTKKAKNWHIYHYKGEGKNNAVDIRVMIT